MEESAYTSAFRIPCAITVSRKTGQITKTEYGQVSEEEFRRICKALIRFGEQKENAGLSTDSDRHPAASYARDGSLL